MTIDEQITVDFYENHHKYNIPRRTFNPALYGKGLDGWIREFCKKNKLSLPKRYSKRNTYQKKGMFFGMLKTYNISLSDIIVDNDYIK